MKKTVPLLIVLVLCLALTTCQAFSISYNGQQSSHVRFIIRHVVRQPNRQSILLSSSFDDDAETYDSWEKGYRGEDDIRINAIRLTLSIAESFRKFRISNGYTADITSEKDDGIKLESEVNFLPSAFGQKVPPRLWMSTQLEGKRQAEHALQDLMEKEYTTLREKKFPLRVVGNATFYDYLVLLPGLLEAFFRYSDPVIYGSKWKTNENLVVTYEARTFDARLAISVLRSLWYLPALSILSGISPACQIIANSYTSRLPDTPIAHEMDTLLLWPAIGNPLDRGLPPTVFQTPAAALTDVPQHDVDWDAVSNIFFSNVATSLVYSSCIALFLYCYLFFGNTSRADTSD